MDKKRLGLTLIGGIIILILVIGATYAYFTVEMRESSSRTIITSETDKIGNIAITEGKTEMYLNVNAKDMTQRENDVLYYAISEGQTNEGEINGGVWSETEVSTPIGGLRLTEGGNEIYSCTYTITIKNTKAGNAKDIIGSLTEDEDLILKIKSEEKEETINLAEIKDNKDKEITGKIKLRGPEDEKKYYAEIYLINSSLRGQKYLADKILGVKIEYDAGCKIWDPKGETYAQEIFGSVPQGLTTEEEQGGMYRYQGECSSAKDCEGKVDNYICFGTNKQEECTNNPSKYMYRIIGIDAKTKELKLIKKEALDDTARWYYQKNADVCPEIPEVTWIHSDAARRLNGYNTVDDLSINPVKKLTPLFVNNENYEYMKEGNEWYAKISSHEWYYGDINQSYVSINADEMYKIETGQSEANYYRYGTLQQGYWQKISQEEANDFKIGLMYLHDFYYSSQLGGRNCYPRGGDWPNCAKSWLNLLSEGNDADAPQPSELLMLRTGGGKIENDSSSLYGEWVIGPTAGPNGQSLWYIFSIRPVFYLKSDIKLTGEGTYNSPFLITIEGDRDE